MTALLVLALVIACVVLIVWTQRATDTFLDPFFQAFGRWAGNAAGAIAESYGHISGLGKACKVAGGLVLVATVILIVSMSSLAAFVVCVLVGFSAAGFIFSVGVAIDQKNAVLARGEQDG